MCRASNRLAQLQEFAWQEGYAAFTLSQSQAAIVERYIATHAEHHRKRSFEEELIEFLRAHEIEYDEHYIGD